ncbi:hypothetical protein B0H13DRAFT_2402902 [Mycena leptocephala]|nr:hypothetical protein B0H13DRAFT_2402902 [Mycena leptocephala]
MLSTSRASPAFISLLKTLNMNIFTHIWMCNWNPNAFAHDMLTSVARPAPSPFCDECAILVRSLPCFLVLFLPSTPPFIPLYRPTSVLYIRPPHLLNASRRTERASPPRRRIPNAVPHAQPAHTITHSRHPHSRSPPPMSPTRPPCPYPAQRYPAARSSCPPYPQRTTHAPKCMRVPFIERASAKFIRGITLFTLKFNPAGFLVPLPTLIYAYPGPDLS